MQKSTNELPPFAPTWQGNFQMLLSPTAEPMVARMKPTRPDQVAGRLLFGVILDEAAATRIHLAALACEIC